MMNWKNADDAIRLAAGAESITEDGLCPLRVLVKLRRFFGSVVNSE